MQVKKAKERLLIRAACDGPAALTTLITSCCRDDDSGLPRTLSRVVKVFGAGVAQGQNDTGA